MKNGLIEIENGERLCVSVPEAARMLGISRNNCYELVKRGELPSIRLGNRILIPYVQLKRMMEGEYAK